MSTFLILCQKRQEDATKSNLKQVDVSTRHLTSQLVKMFLKLIVICCLVAMKNTYVTSFRPSCRNFPRLCPGPGADNETPVGLHTENLQNSVGGKRSYRWKQKFGVAAEIPDLGKYSWSKHAQK